MEIKCRSSHARTGIRCLRHCYKRMREVHLLPRSKPAEQRATTCYDLLLDVHSYVPLSRTVSAPLLTFFPFFVLAKGPVSNFTLSFHTQQHHGNQTPSPRRALPGSSNNDVCHSSALERCAPSQWSRRGPQRQRRAHDALAHRHAP